MPDKQDPITHAARLLREAAEELRQAHTLSSDRNNWIGEPEAKAAYDEHMAADQALEDWEAAVGAGGVQALSAAPAGWRELAAKVMDALADAQDTTNSQYPEHVRCYPSWERHARWLRWHADMFRSGNPVGNGAGNPDVLAALAASPTPPAEQQAAPKAAPGDNRKAFESWARRQPWIKDCGKASDGDAYGHWDTQKAWLAWGAALAAPQQEAQGPSKAYAWVYVNKYGVDSIPASKDWCATMVSGHGGSMFPLYTAPQPAPVVGRMSPSKEWLETRLAIADDSDVQAGVPSKNARPCDAPPGCDSHNCHGCDDFKHPSPTPQPAPQQEAQEPVAVPRFNCWSTNEGDSWFDHPADSQAIYDCLGNDAKVGDEYELTAGWTSVTARYRITEVVGDGEEYEVECISHPHENSAPQPAPAPLSDDTERLEWLLWKLPGDALRYVVGELSDTSSGAEFRAAIDAALAAQGGKDAG